MRNTKDVLCLCSLKITKLFYTNLSNFINLYESPAYLLRNALTEIIQHVIRFVLTYSDENEAHDNLETLKKTKYKLFDKLLTRVVDKHAFGRAKVLDAFYYLCLENVVP